MKKIISAIIVFSALPSAALAACSTPSGTSLANPLNTCTIEAFVASLLQIVLTIAMPIIGFFLVLAGFRFISARGNQAKLTAAKQNFLYVIIGAALILGAWVLANLLLATVSQLLS